MQATKLEMDAGHISTHDQEGLLSIGRNLQKYILDHHQKTKTLNEMMEESSSTYGRELSEMDFSREDIEDEEMPKAADTEKKTPIYVKLTVDVRFPFLSARWLIYLGLF